MENLVTQSELKKRLNWSDSTIRRRKEDGSIREYRIGNSRPYYNIREIEAKFQPVAKSKDGE